MRPAPWPRTPHPTRARRARRALAAALLAPLALVVLAGCAERRSPVEIRAHTPEWSLAGAADFHGERVEESGPGTCTTCHGDDLAGSAEVPGCYDCHAGPGGHPGGWANPAAPRFHGDEVARTGPSSCAACHGADYLGGWSEVSCSACHAGGPSGHPDGWMVRESASFHGLRVLTEGVTDCTRCHGFGLGGGTSGVSCGSCHE